MIKHPMIADDDDATQEQTPDPSRSSVNGDDVSGDPNGARRKKNISLEQLEANWRNAFKAPGRRPPTGRRTCA